MLWLATIMQCLSYLGASALGWSRTEGLLLALIVLVQILVYEITEHRSNA